MKKYFYSLSIITKDDENIGNILSHGTDTLEGIKECIINHKSRVPEKNKESIVDFRILLSSFDGTVTEDIHQFEPNLTENVKLILSDIEKLN